MKYLASYKYDNASRKIAHGIKQGDMSSIKSAAADMAALVPGNAVLVPVPSHTGIATETLKLCHEISVITGAPIYDVLRGKERDSLYSLKKSGVSVRRYDLGLYTTADLPEGRTVVVIDNVIDTGTTAKAAHEAIGNCIMIAYAMTSKVRDYP